MEYVAKTNGMEFGTDVKLVTVGTVSNFYNYFITNPNKTLYGVLFCTEE
jgi:hypothetical protein